VTPVNVTGRGHVDPRRPGRSAADDRGRPSDDSPPLGIEAGSEWKPAAATRSVLLSGSAETRTRNTHLWVSTIASQLRQSSSDPAAVTRPRRVGAGLHPYNRPVIGPTARSRLSDNALTASWFGTRGSVTKGSSISLTMGSPELPFIRPCRRDEAGRGEPASLSAWTRPNVEAVATCGGPTTIKGSSSAPARMVAPREVA
jgi:hypothetical protein